MVEVVRILFAFVAWAAWAPTPMQVRFWEALGKYVDVDDSEEGAWRDLCDYLSSLEPDAQREIVYVVLRHTFGAPQLWDEAVALSLESGGYYYRGNWMAPTAAALLELQESDERTRAAVVRGALAVARSIAYPELRSSAVHLLRANATGEGAIVDLLCPSEWQRAAVRLAMARAGKGAAS